MSEQQQEIDALRHRLQAAQKQLELYQDCLVMVASRLRDLAAEPVIERHRRIETSLQFAIQEIRNTLPQEDKDDDDD